MRDSSGGSHPILPQLVSISFTFHLLRTLCHLQKSLPPCFQAIPNSCCKNTGGGLPGSASNLQLQTSSFTLPEQDLQPQTSVTKDEYRSFASDPSSGLCPQHAAPTRAANFREALNPRGLRFPKAPRRQQLPRRSLQSPRRRTHLAPPRLRARLHQQPAPPHPPRHRLRQRALHLRFGSGRAKPSPIRR